MVTQRDQLLEYLKVYWRHVVEFLEVSVVLWLFVVDKMDDNIHEHLIVQNLVHVFDDIMVDKVLSSLLLWVPGHHLVLLFLQFGMVFHFLVVEF